MAGADEAVLAKERCEQYKVNAYNGIGNYIVQKRRGLVELPTLGRYEQSQRSAKKVPNSAKSLRTKISDIRWCRQYIRGGIRDPLNCSRTLGDRLCARKEKNAEKKRVKEFLEKYPIHKDWTKKNIVAVSEAARLDFRIKAHDAAGRASLEAVARELKKRGWALTYTSKHNGRASSRYMVNGQNQVRISDHELPLTDKRMHDQQNGHAGDWNAEHIVDERRAAIQADEIENEFYAETVGGGF